MMRLEEIRDKIETQTAGGEPIWEPSVVLPKAAWVAVLSCIQQAIDISEVL